ncbi:sulfite exporter TauE/SafE family protein [Moraxella sp. FZLJ2107]|uniref:sulfite exporter TauE/SafE family protein n=1 Tax=unclassified Moraxella TaxID=2685852 RepID=UPI0020C8ADDF|nr:MULTISPECIES: sulfite exporter TauE/SafE family protein [unclassified Moraxella]UTO04210.1 sulfite exporter TauE/SafE family protein [Moraxella sp. FZLJ2107]UTO23043.1 sulfite exporter TauE/SafE family protein [Moraxella sp. FZLJ2109]
MINDLLLALVNFLTSLLTGITGLGGGSILVGLLPLFLPAAAIVPVHAAGQLASNASRAWFGRDSLDWRYVTPYVVGSLCGIAVFWLLVRFIDLEWVPLFIAVYILLIVWVKPIKRWLENRQNFFVIGFIQMGIGMFVGSPGPLHVPPLIQKYDDMNTAISTASVMMTFFHVLKIIAYMVLGFHFLDYWQVIVMMSISAVIGSWLGTILRHKMPMPWLTAAMPWILTAVALQVLVRFVWSELD